MLILSRQPMPPLDHSRLAAARGVAQRAYVLAGATGGGPALILIASGSGSKLGLALAAHQRLTADGVASSVVSMPSWDLCEQQTPEYRDSVLPPAVSARLAIEQANSFGWERCFGPSGKVIGMHTFGASTPLQALQQKFGFDVEHVLQVARTLHT